MEEQLEVPSLTYTILNGAGLSVSRGELSLYADRAHMPPTPTRISNKIAKHYYSFSNHALPADAHTAAL